MNKLIMGILLAAVICAAPAAVLADCPNKGQCSLSWGGSSTQYKDLGTIYMPTCWKFGKGCRPWHCGGQEDKNSDYWLNKCVSEFNVKHDPSHSNEILWLQFQGGITGNYSRDLK